MLQIQTLPNPLRQKFESMKIYLQNFEEPKRTSSKKLPIFFIDDEDLDD